MALMRPFSSVRNELERFFDDFNESLSLPGWRTRGLRERSGEGEWLSNWTPAVDVIEENGNIKVKAVVPGMKPEDINIEVEDDVLCLSGETTKTDEEEHENFYRREIIKGRFYRRVPLPTAVESDKAKADFKDGVLTVTMPKSQETRRHKIQINNR